VTRRTPTTRVHRALTLVELLAALAILSAVAAAGSSILTGARTATADARLSLSAGAVLQQAEGATAELLDEPRLLRGDSGRLWRATAIEVGEAVDDASELAALSGYRWVEVRLERHIEGGRFELVASVLRLLPPAEDAAS